MFTELISSLKNTRKTLVMACKECGVSPTEVIVEELPIAACDNCGIWLSTKQLVFDATDTRLCNFCNDLDTLRF